MSSHKITELMLYMRKFEASAKDHLASLVHNQRQNEIGRRESTEMVMRTMSGGALTKVENVMRGSGGKGKAYAKAKQDAEILREDLSSSPAVRKTIAALNGASEIRGMHFEEAIDEARAQAELASELLKGITALRERGFSTVDIAQDISAMTDKNEILATLKDTIEPFLQPEAEPGMAPDNGYNPKPQPRNRPAPTIDM